MTGTLTSLLFIEVAITVVAAIIAAIIIGLNAKLIWDLATG